MTVREVKEMLSLYGKKKPALEKLIKDKPDEFELDLVDRNDYVGYTLWHEDDIKEALLTEGFDDTARNIDLVVEALGDGLNDCSDGWEYINHTIFALNTKLLTMN